MKREEIEDIYTLSPTQAGMLFQALAQPEGGVYFEQGVCTLRGPLNTAVFNDAWQRVVARHAVLRTSFAWAGLSKPVQIVHRAVQLPFAEMDWRTRTAAEQQQRERLFLQDNRRRGVSLSEAPLMRLSLLRLADDVHRCVWGIHHLIHDAWSTFLLLGEVLAIYEALLNGREPQLPPAPAFRDYIAWQKRQTLEDAESYWRQTLRGFTEPTPLPHVQTAPSSAAPFGQEEAFLSAEATAELNAFARQQQLTLNTVLLGAWALYLGRMSGRRDIVFGTVLSGRPPELPGVAEMIGPLINTLPTRVLLPEQATLLDWLQELQRAQLRLRDFEHTPLRSVQSWSEIANGQPLFNSIVIFQNAFGDLSGKQVAGVCIEQVHSLGHSNFPLSLRVTPRARLWLEALYDASRFSAESVNTILTEFQSVLLSLVKQPTARLGEFLTVARRTFSKKLNQVQPKAVVLAAQELVVCEPLQSGGAFPLLVRPHALELDLTDWAAGNRAWIESALLRHGALLFRGFRVNALQSFERFMQTLSPELLEYRERSTPRTQLQGKVYSSTEYPPHQEIAFHNEFSYAYTWPMKIAFGCVQASATGGETPLADSRAVYAKLSPALRKRFEQEGVMYVRNYGAGIDLSWEEAFQTTDRAVVEAYCRQAPLAFEWRVGNRLRTRQIRHAVTQHPRTREMVWFNQAHLFHLTNLEPAVRQAMAETFSPDELPRNAYYGSGAPIEDDVLEEIRTVYQAASIRFPWQPGDVLLLDNVLIAHGRRSFTGARKIIVAMAEPFTVPQFEPAVAATSAYATGEARN